MRTLSKLFVLAASVAISTSLAYADTLGVGQISIDGFGVSYTPATSTSPGMVSFTGGTAGNGYGSLAGFDGGAVNFGSTGTVTLDIATENLANPMELLTITEGTSVLTYYLDAITMASNSGGDISLNTAGYFTDSGPTGDTNGSFDFTTQGTTGEATSYSGTGDIAPEPSSLLLFGTGLLSAAGIARRKFAARFV